MKFSIEQALRFGWQMTLDHIILFLCVILTGFLVNVIRFGGIILVIGAQVLTELAFVRPTMHEISTALGMRLIIGAIIVFLLFKLVDSMYAMGTTRICLEMYDSGKSNYAELFSCMHLVFNHIIASLLYVTLVSFGFLLLVIPGFIWAIKYWFYQHAIVDKQMGPLEALSFSGQITKGQKGQLAIFLGILWSLNIIAGWAFGIGLIITLPLSFLAQAFVYRKLLLNL